VLLDSWLEITQDWRNAFPQQRSFERALSQGLGSLCALGRRTVSRAIFALGRQQQDWSAEYKLHARCHWDPDDLFQGVLNHSSPWCKGRYLAVAMDDTRLRKTGKRIPGVSYGRDPMSPPFHCNLMLGLRFLQCSLQLPLYRVTKASPRALPVRFLEVPVLQRPRRSAPAEDWKHYHRQQRQHSISHAAMAALPGLRSAADRAGAAKKVLLAIADNTYCNRVMFRNEIPGVQMLARARKDLRLCFPAPPGSRAFYGAEKFTPEQVRQDEAVVWKKVRVFYGGQWRKLRYKELTSLLWQSGAARRWVRLIVLAPIPYQVAGRARKYYRDPAYLLTTELQATAHELIQMYLDRWQIEVNHREEKDTLGVGQAQVRSVRSVPRQPALVVAAYSALLLAALRAFGPGRTEHFAALPKWRRHASRPSCQDLVTLLRNELMQANGKTEAKLCRLLPKTLITGAAA
jgi:hypothetical protein